MNEHPSPTGKSQTSSSSSVVANNPSISYENFQKVIHNDKNVFRQLMLNFFSNKQPSPYEESEREQIEAAIKASLQDMEVHNNHDDDDDDDCKIVKNDSMIEQQQPKQDDWRNYLGSDESNKMEIVIRYPNGNKEKVMFPSDSKLKVCKLWNFINNKFIHFLMIILGFIFIRN